MDLTPDVIFALLQSEKQFPVDFDDAMAWWDCRTKQGAPVRRDNLAQKLKDNFDQDRDFVIFAPEILGANKQGRGGHNKDLIRLTVDCFKSFGMMVSGERGKQIRRYFLDCEAELKRRVDEESRRNKQRVVRAIVADSHSPWRKRFDDEFFDEAYRVTGWQPPVSGHPPCMAQFINETIYSYFPDGTQERLNEVNPRENGRRKRKQHQHLTNELGSPILESQKAAVYAVMRLSPDNNRGKFRQNMQKALSNVIQIELPFMEDEQAS